MRPIIVRLPNWVGDVVMALPAVSHVAQAGFTPQLVGKPWATALLAGHDWDVHPRPGPIRARVGQLRELQRRAADRDSGFDDRVNTLLLTNSFSSALEARLARLRPLGYRQDSRGWLLTVAVPVPSDPIHESERFWRLAVALTGVDRPQPHLLRLAVAPLAQQAADALLARHAVGGDFACIVPFATGTLNGRSKAWPDFPAFAARLATRLPVIVVPGPTEAALAREAYPAALTLEGADLGVYAGLLKRARLVVSNDTGPGHLAAAVGTPLLSVLGPTDAVRYRPWGDHVTIVQADPWPTIEAVDAGMQRLLAG